MDDNNNSRIILEKKIDEMAMSFSDFHTMISRNGVLPANSSLHKSLSDLHLMLKKVDSDFVGNNDVKVKADETEHYDVNSEHLSDHNPSSLFPHSPLIPCPSVKLEGKTGKSVILDNNFENVDNTKNGSETSNTQTYKNTSVTELKTLENDILAALKRLEKTNSNLGLEKET
jgi:hypothetical protein